MTPFAPRHVPFSMALQHLHEGVRHGTSFSPVDWMSNFLLFVPLAFFALGSIGNSVKSNRLCSAAPAFVFAALVGFSSVLEVLQIWMAGRVPSFHDVVAQSLGAVCGMFLWNWRGPSAVNAVFGCFEPVWRQGITGAVALVYLLGLAAYSLYPIDFTIHPSELRSKWKAGHIVVIPFTDQVASEVLTRSCLKQFALYVPLGLSWLILQSKIGSHDSTTGVALLLVPVVVELLQVFAFSRWASTTQVIAGLAGILVGRSCVLGRRWGAFRSG